jgi:hypothetical protein
MNGERQLQDCGIVYFPGRPYLLCVMAKGAKLGELEKFIKAVSRLVYNSVKYSVRKE